MNILQNYPKSELPLSVIELLLHYNLRTQNISGALQLIKRKRTLAVSNSIKPILNITKWTNIKIIKSILVRCGMNYIVIFFIIIYNYFILIVHTYIYLEKSIKEFIINKSIPGNVPLNEEVCNILNYQSINNHSY